MIRWLLALLGVVALTLFVLANPEAKSMRLWPGGMVLEGAAWQILLGVALAGFVLGAAVVWLAHLPGMRRLARLERSASLLAAATEEGAVAPGVPPRPAAAPKAATGTAVRVR